MALQKYLYPTPFSPVPFFRIPLLSGTTLIHRYFNGEVLWGVAGNGQQNSISHSFVMCGNQRLYNGFPWNCTIGIKVSHDLSDNRPDSFWHRTVGFLLLPQSGRKSSLQHHPIEPVHGFPFDIRSHIISSDGRVFQGNRYPVLFPGSTD